MEKLRDQLSWEEFKKHSEGRKKVPNKISEFNRLVAHSENFFIISGYGAFTKGYLLIISKDFIPSFGLMNKEKYEELRFLIKIIKNFMKSEFDRDSVVFEHGMCACVGGLDRAHIHIMSVPKNTSKSVFVKAINSVLYERKAGINFVMFENYKLENPHDINEIFEHAKKDINSKKIKIDGKLLELNDIKNLPLDGWPLITLEHINKGGHYVYFECDYNEASFLTTYNFQTQFGREVVFNVELKQNEKFEKEVKKIKKNNAHLEVWRWQNCMFEKNIVSTMKSAKKVLGNFKLKFDKDFKKFKFKII
tara:strand:- start:1835 stop:2752 length:918 start_codon:yes stop_codon:yes gene_type:complete